MSLAARINALLADEIAVPGDDSLLHRAIGAGPDGSTPSEMAYRRVEVLFAAWQELHRERDARRPRNRGPREASA